MIGFCARQVGHQGAEISTSIGLAVLLRRREGGRRERLPIRGERRERAEQGGGDGRGGEQRGDELTVIGSDPP